MMADEVLEGTQGGHAGARPHRQECIVPFSPTLLMSSSVATGATPDSSQYVVIGAGLIGAATAWQLAAAGHEVTVVERSTPANAEGSSHGSARIFRYPYHVPLYTRLVVDAAEGWSALEAESGQQLIARTGSLDFGAIRRAEALAAVLEQAGIDHELLSASAAQERWPMLEFDTDVLWHPDAGVIDAESSVRAMLQLAIDHGARLLTEWEVTAVEHISTGYRLTSTTGHVVSAGAIVVCAGGWLPDLLERLPIPTPVRQASWLVVRQEQAFHLPYREDVAPASAWPTFIHKSPEIEMYSLPGGRDAGFRGQKLAQFQGGRIIGSAAGQNGIVDAANRDRIIDYATRHLPGAHPVPYAETTCLFTSTPTEDFILDRIDGITVVSPCSGHGAKFAPLIGEFAAGLATGAGGVPEQFRIFGQDSGRLAGSAVQKVA